MGDYYQPAKPVDRAVAAAIDLAGSLGVMVVFWIIRWPVFGMLLSTAYLLLRDGAEGRSLGKRMRKLCTVNLNDQAPATWKDSVLRNLDLAIPILGLVVLVVEIYIAFFKDRNFRRLGDQLAHTMVIDESSLQEEEEK